MLCKTLRLGLTHGSEVGIQRADLLNDSARDILRAEPVPGQHFCAFAVVEELLWQPMNAQWRRHASILQGTRECVANPTDTKVVLDRYREPVLPGELYQTCVDRQRPPRVDHCHADALVNQTACDVERARGHRA